MISDNQANTVYFSEHIATDEKYSPAWSRIEAVLKEHYVNYHLLKGTKDIWARDYMPVQVSDDKFVQFCYHPSYLVGYENLQSDPQEVLKVNGLKALSTDLNVDGGNIIRWTDKVIMSRRIFKENPGREESVIKQELENLLEVPVYFIKDINTDLTGHVDGMMRFVNGSTLLVNQMEGELKYVRDSFDRLIAETGLKSIQMPWFTYKDSKNRDTAVGVYVNYLEIGNLIIFPVFEVAGNRDEEALQVIQSAFPEKKIVPVNINEIASEGGLLNCISWTVKR